MIRKLAIWAIVAVVVLAMGTLLMLVLQAKRKPDTSGQYVALGSSFAAGLGLGPRDPGSPFVCMRSANGYPQQLARLIGLRLVDMSCSGSTTTHILRGGQMFLGPQIAAIGPNTRLVTITSGGNDVGYIGDLTLASGRAGLLGKLLWKGPKPVASRDYAKVSDNFRKIIDAVRANAPTAVVVVVSYPAVLPADGACPSLGFGPDMAATGRDIAARLLAATRAAAQQSGALFVDMASASKGHDACSAEPWVNGAAPASGAPFHPTLAGAEATARAVMKAIEGRQPAG